jgi:deazaflavin-dependent oxidoreductase (nitroreductase family)
MPATKKPKTLSTWSAARPGLASTSALARASTRLNVYQYAKPPSKTVKRISKSFLYLNVVLFRATHGKIPGRSGGTDGLLLTTTEGATGKKRTSPLGYLYDRGRFVVCAAPGHFEIPGDPQATHPGWYLNLCTNPRVTVDIGAERFGASAEVLSGDERDRMWKRFTGVFPFITGLQNRAGHLIPVVVLTPSDLDPQRL